jgi:hypothetical protein
MSEEHMEQERLIELQALWARVMDRPPDLSQFVL